MMENEVKNDATAEVVENAEGGTVQSIPIVTNPANVHALWVATILNFFIEEAMVKNWKWLPEEDGFCKIELTLCDNIAKEMSLKFGSNTNYGIHFLVCHARTHAELAEYCWYLFNDFIAATRIRYIDKLLSPVIRKESVEMLDRWKKWKKENAPPLKG